MGKYLPLISLLVALVILLVPAGLILGDTYSYYVVIDVFNNSSNVYGVTPVLVAMNNTQLALWGYINATGLNTDFQEGAADNVYMVALPNLGAFAESFAGGQVRTYYYRLNNLPVQTGFPVIVGVGGSMTVVDDPTLELGNNFTVEVDGYIDTGAASYKDLVYKGGAFRIYVDGADTITSGIASPPALVVLNQTTNAPGDYTNIDGLVGAPTHWEAVETLNDATYVWTGNVVQVRDTYNLISPTWFGDVQSITSVTVYYRVQRSAVALGAKVQPFLRLGGVEINGTEYEINFGGWIDRTELIGRPGGGSWTVADLEDLQLGLGLLSDGATFPRCSQEYIRVAYNTTVDVVEVTALNVVSGEHLVQVATNTTWMSISVDGTQRDQTALGGTSVSDNPNGWILMRNRSIPYLDELSVYINGTREGWWEPTVMVDPSNVPDRTGNGNTGTINWGANPADIEVTVGGLLPFSESEMPSGGEPGDAPLIFEVPEDLGIYENATATGANLPLFELFERGGDSLGWTAANTYAILGMIIPSIAMIFAVGIGTGSIMLGFLFGGLMLAVAAGTGIIAPWIPAVIAAFAIMLMYVLKRT